MYNEAVIAVVRDLDPAVLAALVESPAFLARATEAFGHSKINGHITVFLRLINDRRAVSNLLQTAEWSEFANGTLFQHLRRVSESYGGPYAQRPRSKLILRPSSSDATLDEIIARDAQTDSVSPIRSSPGPIASALRSTPPGFDYIAPLAPTNVSSQVNTTEVPSLHADAIVPERRSRRRNMGSVSLSDLPRCFGTASS
jgi:hypothetical protein